MFRASHSFCLHLPSSSFAPNLCARMQDLLKKIEANAAARLVFAPERTAVQELPRYKGFLKVETHRLKLLHRSGGSGLEVCQARAAIRSEEHTSELQSPC